MALRKNQWRKIFQNKRTLISSLCINQTSMEIKFEEILKEGLLRCLAEKGIKNFNSASLQQLGKSLTQFYIYEIGMYLYQIYEDDIEGAMCDGKGDLGVDFIYKKEKEWLIFQSKYKGQGAPLTSGEIADFFQIYDRITSHEYFDKHANKCIRENLLDFSENDTLQFIFITNTKITAPIEDEFKRLKEKAESKNENLTYELKGISDLKRDYKSVVSEAEAIADEVVITIEQLNDSFTNSKRSAYFDLSAVVDRDSVYKSILCTIKGTTLKALWLQHRSRLFNYNVRGALGENAINKKMRDTLDKEPEKFYFYNNGISAICTEIIPELSDGTIKGFRCKDFSIINGAQTTSTMGRYRNDSHLKEVRVLLKITKAEHYKKEKGLNKKIITYNNSQTIIKTSDFRSNDDVQIFLENKLCSYQYKGSIPYKKVRYLRKRVKTEKKKEILDITIESLARALFVFDNDPILIFKGTKYLFETDSETGGKYWLVFGDDGIEQELYDNKRLEKIIGIFFLWTKLEEKIKLLSKQIKLESNESIKYQALLAKWHILWAYGYILRTYYSKELDSIFKRLSSGKIFESQDQNFIERWFSKVHNTIAKCIQRNYQATVKKGEKDIQSFNFKNWLRSNTAFEELITEFQFMEKSDFPL